MAKKATSPALTTAFTKHLQETKNHVTRLEQIAKELETKPSGKKCHGIKGLIEEGQEVVDEDGKSAVIDAALIGAAQRVEHYEMAGYGTARAMAEQLGHTKVVKLLQQTLDEEGAADEKLKQIAQDGVLADAQSAGDGEEEEEEEAA